MFGKAKIQELETQLTTVKQKLDTALKEKTDLDAQLKSAKNRIGELEQKLADTDLTQLKEEARKTIVEYEGLKELYQKKNQELDASREDLEAVRQALSDAGCGHLRLFAKVENREGMERLQELIGASDEIVIARGDLGNAMPLWELPAAQKTIAKRCRAAGRDFMVVTQMLSSMEQNPVPTRAEVSDIFNAVLDGAASVMVTGETAAGSYPALAIRYLARTAREAEAYRQHSAGETESQ